MRRIEITNTIPPVGEERGDLCSSGFPADERKPGVGIADSQPVDQSGVATLARHLATLLEDSHSPLALACGKSSSESPSKSAKQPLTFAYRKIVATALIDLATEFAGRSGTRRRAASTKTMYLWMFPEDRSPVCLGDMPGSVDLERLRWAPRPLVPLAPGGAPNLSKQC